jgi:DNA-binding transcriptional MerR regulator
MPDADSTTHDEDQLVVDGDGGGSGTTANASDAAESATDSDRIAGATPLSIGEVLEVLSEEFPDVTISKIRFLESQGLVQPERNTSGYRQFGNADIERLRWILRQQRDHFLPLKVIRRALERGVDVIDAGAGDQPTLWTAVAEAAAQEEIGDEKERIARSEAADARKDAARSRTHPSTRKEQKQAGSGAVRGAPVDSRRRRYSSPADVVAALQEDPREPLGSESGPTGGSRAAPAEVKSPDPAAGSDEVPQAVNSAAETNSASAGVMPSGGQMRQLGREELLGEARLSAELLDELVEFGLVEPVEIAGEATFDQVDLAVAVLARRSSELGVSPRHLRMYRVAAVREAGLLEQVAMPLLKQRNPAAKARATETVADLTQMGAELHQLLLARELGPHLAP